jgi:hypothetical protein
LEKRVAVAAAPSSEIAVLTTRLNKLEKRAAVAGASSANPLPPAAPKQSSLMARAEPSAPNETARSDDLGPLLSDYSVENVHDGIAVVDSRDGPQEVSASGAAAFGSGCRNIGLRGDTLGFFLLDGVRVPSVAPTEIVYQRPDTTLDALQPLGAQHATLRIVGGELQALERHLIVVCRKRPLEQLGLLESLIQVVG